MLFRRRQRTLPLLLPFTKRHESTPASLSCFQYGAGNSERVYCRVSQPAAFDSLCIAEHLPSIFTLTAFNCLSSPAPGNLPSIRKKRQIPGGGGLSNLSVSFCLPQKEIRNFGHLIFSSHVRFMYVMIKAAESGSVLKSFVWMALHETRDAFNQ